MEPRTEPLELRLSDGITLALPADLASVTTYVVLEQETWFEKELRFVRRWLQPGMTAIDIGANYGVYSVAMAQSVGSRGRVIAFEPASEPRRLLELSRIINGANNLEIVDAALSDARRSGHLVFGTSSEGNALGEGGPGESVRVTSLDIESGARNWPPPDFVKIDAEGEEQRILAGGRDFFTRCSPLVMFEISRNEETDRRLFEAFAAMGYRLFRQLPGEPILVPIETMPKRDPYELNLFAVKPARMRALIQEGMLVAEIPQWTPGATERDRALTLLRRQAFAPALGPRLSVSLDPDYQDALAAYNVWRTPSVPPVTRCAALSFAVTALRNLCAQKPSAPRIATYSRAAWDWGAREESFKALQALNTAPQRIEEPFWPPCPRYDALPTGPNAGAWFSAAAAEHIVRAAAHSCMFLNTVPNLAWLNQQPFACAETIRRETLMAARSGKNPRVPERLCRQAVDHLNAEVWRSGRVPGTVIGA